MRPRRFRLPRMEQLEFRALLDGDGVMVTATSVITQHDTVPRFAANAEFVALRSGDWSDPLIWNLLSVPRVGSKVSIPHSIDVDYDLNSSVKLDAIEVSGRLDFETEVDTSLWLRELMVMPNGVLTIGEPGNPVQSNVNAEIVFVDSPLRTSTIDPSQYGSGLLAFGEVTIHGHQLENTFVRIAGDALAGATQINLQASVSDWRVGDSVIVPDTRHVSPVTLPGFYDYKPQWEIRKITAIDGSRITVDAPLVFDHRGARDASGAGTVNFDGETLAAHVGNLSRNVTLRSENPNGVRGHTQFFANAEIDIRYAAFEELGRTEAEPLDNTRFDQAGNVTHIGTNQIGRYSQHFHHVNGPRDGIFVNGQRYQWVSIGNAINGSGKWGTAIHDSHFGLLQDNVYYNIDGSAVAAEDGSEFGNVIDGNFVVRVNGNAKANKAKDNGDQGDGLWFAGPMNTVTNNVVTNVFHVGIAVNPDDIPNKTVRVPIAPGSSLRRTTSILKEVVANFDGNEIYGATDIAVLLWNVGDRRLYYPNEPGVNTVKNTSVWHVLSDGIVLYYMDSIVIDGWIQRGDPFMIQRGFVDGGPRDPSISSAAGAAIWIGGANARDVEIKNADIQNMTYGLINRGRGFADQIDVVDSYFDNLFNVVNLPWTQTPSDGVRDLVLRNVDFGDLVSPGASNTIDMEWYSPTPNEATKRESVTVHDFGDVPGLSLELFYLEQVPGGIADNVPPGMPPAGIVAPVERDGDNGQAATLRGRALGIKGLVFEKFRLSSPHLFANVESNSGKPTLYFATLGGLSSVNEVSFKIDGQVFNFPSVNGRLDLSFLPNGTYRIEGSLNGQVAVSRNLVLPLRTVPGAINYNRPPVVSKIGDMSVVANHLLSFQIVASDPDSDSLSYEVAGLPASATLSTKGFFEWTPTNDQAGEYSAEFKVIDSKGLATAQRVKISVAFDTIDSLVGDWALDSVVNGKAIDNSLHGFHGQAVNVTALGSQGLLFNGRDSLVRIAPTLAHKPESAITVSVEVKSPGNMNHFSRLIGHESGSVSAYELTVKDGGYMRDERGLLSGYWFSVHTTTGLHHVSWRSQAWGKTSFDKVVGVYDGEREGGWMGIYVNGVLADERSGVGTKIVYAPFGTQEVLLGGRSYRQQMFAGALANAQIRRGVFPNGDGRGNLVGEGENSSSFLMEKQDVNGDGLVSPADALRVINYLNADGSVLMPIPLTSLDSNSSEPTIDLQWWRLDVNGDGRISPADALEVINRLNVGVQELSVTDSLAQFGESIFELDNLRKRPRKS